MEIALLSDSYAATDALALGLVNKVVPRSELTAVTDALARRLASGPTLAYGRIKKLLRGSFDRTMEQQMAFERTAFRESTLTADFKEGTLAFVGKRRAKFTGA
jgi:2-(1,2-epoxy-1,2-dihydrophenyl)acetyl-CoA isomerase